MRKMDSVNQKKKNQYIFTITTIKVNTRLTHHRTHITIRRHGKKVCYIRNKTPKFELIIT